VKFQILEKSVVAKGLFVHSSLLETVIITEFQATEAYSSLDLTNAKYSISKLSEVEKGKVVVQISPSNFSACEKRKST
jgi:hypothetical protein